NCDTAIVYVPVTAAPIEAIADYGTSVNGYTGGTSLTNVLANDLLNGVAVIPSEVTLTFVSSSDPGVTLVGSNVVVAAGTAAGDYTLIYQICEVLNPTNCDTAIVYVPVTAAPIEAIADYGTSVNGYTGGTSLTNVLGNDLLNGVAVIPSEVTLTFVSSSDPGVTLVGNNVVVAAGTAAGDYTLIYQICEVLNPTNCDTAIVYVPVYTCPEILTQPVGGTICDGNTFNLSVTANEGSSPVTYQWQVSEIDCLTGFIDIQGATNASYTTLPLHATSYFRCVILPSNPLCSQLESSCAVVTVNPLGQVNQPESQVVCNGSVTSVAFLTINTGGTTTYSWTNNTTGIGLDATGTGDISFIAVNTGTVSIAATIVVTPVFTNNGVSCTGPSKTFTITVNPAGQVNAVDDRVVCNGSLTTPVNFSTVNTGGNTTYAWTNDMPGIGLASAGTGNIDAFTAVNTGSAPVVATITVTPTFEKKSVSCEGISKTFTITVNPTGQVNASASQTVCKGALTTAVVFTTNNTGGTTLYTWTNNAAGIGLAVNGSGSIPAFIATNSGTAPLVATLTVTPHFTYGMQSCDGPAEIFTITVNPSGQVNDPADQAVCNGSLTTGVTFTTNNTSGTTAYTWTNNNTGIGLAAVGSGNIPAFVAGNSGNSPAVAVVTVTPYYTYGNQTCEGIAQTFTISVNPSGQVNDPSDQALCAGSQTTPVIFTTSNPVGTTTYTWTNNTPGIGLAASGSGNIPAFTATNTSPVPVVATITVIPHFTYGSLTCDGASQTVLITVYPKPLLVTHPQSTCSPNKVDLTAAAVTSGSTPGLTFTYWMNAGATIPMTHPTTAGGGTYYIKGTLTATGCFAIQPVTVTINPLPTVFNPTGSGGYCAGGPGREIGLSGSQPGFLYTLYYECCTPTGITVVGTGGPLSFGYHTSPGLYSILAQNPATGCFNWMYYCVYIWVDQPVPVSISIEPSANPVQSGTEVSFVATPTNGGISPTYQWKVNGIVVGTNSPTYSYIPLNDDEVTCILTSNEYCVSGNPASASEIMVVQGLTPVNTVSGIIAGGNSKCYSATQTLTVAGGTTTFVVEAGSSVTMIAGQNIRYLPGTSINPGGYMHGYITTDNQYCGQQAPSIPLIVAGENQLPYTSEQTFFTIYPNPTNGNFTLEQRSGRVYDKVQVEVYNMHGKKVVQGELIGEKKHEFRTSDLPHGLYFVTVV
ncbi:MAG: T9SS type A sorting domain-containing protein, partial [Anaerolineales bacterium]|nr:T9SS type A sorting domain-containing protein [Anaerolineales bacterium]